MEVLKALRSHEDFIKEKFGVERIGIFGSFARGQQRKDSDVDVVVTFVKGKKTFDSYMELKFYLEDVFGREVDLVIETSIRPSLRDTIVSEAVYA